jgi:hypothetical protein
MDRREFIKLSSAACGAFVVISNTPHLVPIETAAAKSSAGASGTGASKAGPVPDYAKGMLDSILFT